MNVDNKELPKGWVFCQFSYLVKIIRGVSYKKNQSSLTVFVGSVPILRATNINGGINFNNLVYVPNSCVSEEQLLQVGDVILAASSGSKNIVGKAARINEAWEGSFGAFCYGIRVRKNINSKYVGFFLQTTDYRNTISKLSAGVNINNIKRQHLESLILPLSPSPEQDRIVSKIEELFSELDAGVVALERAKANLKRYRASVLKSAVEGKLTETWRSENPGQEPASKLLERILVERRRKWESETLLKYEAKGQKPPKNWKNKYKEPVSPDTSHLLDLPEGWCWATVDQVSHTVRYGSSTKTSLDENGVPVLRMGNIQNGSIETTNLKFLPRDHNEFPELLLQEGDLLFNRTNSAELVGKTAVYGGRPSPCSYASYLIAVKLIDGCHPKFVSYALNSTFGRHWISTVVSQQVGQANVNGTKLKAFSFPLPPLIEQKKIIEQVETKLSVSDQTEDDIESDIRRANRLRQAILKQAFEGKLVPQNPNDETAEKLLERIKAEQAKTNNTKTKSRKKPQRGKKVKAS